MRVFPFSSIMARTKRSPNCFEVGAGAAVMALGDVVGGLGDLVTGDVVQL